MFNLIPINTFGIILKTLSLIKYLVMLETWLNLKMEEEQYLTYQYRIDTKWIVYYVN
jgi:hypothetical protein